MAITTANVHFRVIQCPACSNIFDWLGSRLPTYCPECGRPILEKLRTQQKDLIHCDDQDAQLAFVRDTQ
jgi:DNA-directed RNA polymerase subunit RPC12/RpoP